VYGEVEFSTTRVGSKAGARAIRMTPSGTFGAPLLSASTLFQSFSKQIFSPDETFFRFQSGEPCHAASTQSRTVAEFRGCVTGMCL
jgi:hypothetical protein